MLDVTTDVTVTEVIVVETLGSVNKQLLSFYQKLLFQIPDGSAVDISDGIDC